MSKRLTPLDFTGQEIQNAVFQNLGADPTLPAPIPGRFYFNTAQNQPLYYDPSTQTFVWKATDSPKLNGQLPAYYLARANHTGTQLAATISDLASTVQAYRLDQFASPTGPVSFGNQRLTSLGNATNGTDAINLNQAMAMLQGQDPKPSANWATAAALPANTYNNGTAGVGATLTATANGVLTVDNGTPALNDRIVVKNEATSAYWGLYVLTQLGTASAPYILTRDVTMDQANEFGGALIAVETNPNAGQQNGNGLFLFTAAESITVGTTSLAVTKINMSTALSGSNSILISANTASVINAPGGGIVTLAGGLAIDATVGVRKFAQAFGDGSATSFTITHNLGTQDVTVAIYLAATPFSEVEADVTHATVNTITIATAVAPTSGQYRVVVHG